MVAKKANLIMILVFIVQLLFLVIWISGSFSYLGSTAGVILKGAEIIASIGFVAGLMACLLKNNPYLCIFIIFFCINIS